MGRLAAAGAIVAVVVGVGGYYGSKGKRPAGCPVSRCLLDSAVVSTRAEPDNKELLARRANFVTASTVLSVVVTIINGGDFGERHVKVTLTVQQSFPSPIRQAKTIDVLSPGQEKTLVFYNLGEVQLASRTWVKVDIAPVPGEKNLRNNLARYPVIFILG